MQSYWSLLSGRAGAVKRDRDLVVQAQETTWGTYWLSAYAGSNPAAHIFSE